MDCLSDKSLKEYTYTSRYATIPFYYNKFDDRYMYGLAKLLSDDCSYTAHEVQQGDSPDSLALKYYGRPDLFWVILDFNRIQDSYVDLYGNYKTIKIPSLSSIKFRT